MSRLWPLGALSTKYTMSDTNSKGGKKDTDKIQFIKVGSESFSQIYTKKDKADPRKEPEDFHTRVEDPSAILLDENETGLSPEMQIERLATEDPIRMDAPAPQTEEETNDQVELLKRYVSLKEAEIRDLRDQQKQYQAFIKKLSSQLEQLTTSNRERLNELEGTKQREAQFRRELDKLKEKHEADLSLLKSNYEERIEKLGAVKHQASELEHKKEAWQEKIKEDLKRIKLKEKELENKYELLRRDTQALLDSKDKHVLELKKKNDALDFELETFEDKLRRANAILAAVESKKNKVLDTLRLITSLIEDLNVETIDIEKDRKAG